MSDLETLFPQREVVVRGGTITVLPLFFGQYPKAMKLMRPLFETVKDAGIFYVVENQEKKTVNFAIAPDWPLKLPQLIEEGGEALIAFLGFCIAKPREWFDAVPGDEGFELTKAVFEANADFFSKRILPMLQKMGVANPPTGDVSSPVSSEPAIAGTTSSATPEAK